MIARSALVSLAIFASGCCTTLIAAPNAEDPHERPMTPMPGMEVTITEVSTPRKLRAEMPNDEVIELSLSGFTCSQSVVSAANLLREELQDTKATLQVPAGKSKLGFDDNGRLETDLKLESGVLYADFVINKAGCKRFP